MCVEGKGLGYQLKMRKCGVACVAFMLYKAVAFVSAGTISLCMHDNLYNRQ